MCSNDLGHDKDSIYFWNKYIIDDLKENEIAVKNVHYWSDGPSNQFKNQFLFTNLLFHEQDHQAKANRNLFVITHRKGENDNVGGDVKKCGLAQDLATEGSCHKLRGICVCCKEKVL